MNNRKLHAAAGEIVCEVCSKPLPEMDYYATRQHFTCANAQCRRAVHANARKLIVVKPNERKCDNPGCIQFAAPGSYYPHCRRFFCSKRCESRFNARCNGVEKSCMICGRKVRRPSCRAGANIFCSLEHFGAFLRRNNQKRVGHFMGVLNEYFQTFCVSHYKPGSIRSVQCDLTLFFEFLNAQGVRSLEKVDPKLITRFIAYADRIGKTPNRAVRFLKVFFNWLIVEGRRKTPNPIIEGFHKQTNPKRAPRPYSKKEMELIWKLVTERGETQDKLAIAIGEECGLRIGELCRLRVQDVDLHGQQVFVRLPNKNDAERWVPFSEKTKHFLELWLTERDATCGHDTLLYNSRKNPAREHHISGRLSSILCQKSRNHLQETGLEQFSYHRLRHYMASRLANAGADAMSIMAIGGWKSLNSMLQYVDLQKNTVRRDYDHANQRAKEMAAEEPESIESLEDFARSQSSDLPTPSSSLH